MKFRFSFFQEGIIIYEFSTEIKGKKIISVCKEKEEAISSYDNSIASGHGGYLLEKGNLI